MEPEGGGGEVVKFSGETHRDLGWRETSRGNRGWILVTAHLLSKKRLLKREHIKRRRKPRPMTTGGGGQTQKEGAGLMHKQSAGCSPMQGKPAMCWVNKSA